MDIKSYRAEMNFIFRQPMDFPIILVGGHALRKSVLTVSTKTCEKDFFFLCVCVCVCVCVSPSSHSVCYELIYIRLILNLSAVPSQTPSPADK